MVQVQRDFLFVGLFFSLLQLSSIATVHSPQSFLVSTCCDEKYWNTIFLTYSITFGSNFRLFFPTTFEIILPDTFEIILMFSGIRHLVKWTAIFLRLQLRMKIRVKSLVDNKAFWLEVLLGEVLLGKVPLG